MDITLKETVFGGQINFLDSEKVRYIRGGITLDAAQVTADGNGIKKLAAGTFVGKQGNGKYAKYIPAVIASLTTGVEGNNNAILWTAIKGGTGGNGIKIQLKDPAGNDQLLKVLVETDTIIVSLATGGAGAITSTAAQVIAAVNASLLVKDLVTAANAGTSTGAGVVAAVAATSLAGGANTNITPSAILTEDIIFTTFTSSGGVSHADKVVTAIDQGRVIVSRLPVAPDDAVKASLNSITFV
jgi:hypothetical protein